MAPVIERPGKIVCVGLNYRAHAAEQKVEPPKAPMLFCKASNIVIGPDGNRCTDPFSSAG